MSNSVTLALQSVINKTNKNKRSILEWEKYNNLKNQESLQRKLGQVKAAEEHHPKFLIWIQYNH